MNLREFFAKAERRGRKNLTEYESQKILQHYQIPVAETYLAKTVQQAVVMAENIGYPVVLKVSSPAVIHKTEVGGYVLNIHNRGEVETAFRKIMNNVRRHTNKIDGILVQKMESGLEVMVGSKKDAQFGNVLVFGLGGVMVEAIGDVAMRVLPITKTEVEEMIAETKAYKILSGGRGRKYDIDTLIKIILRLAKMLKENSEINEIDLNPVIVSSEGAVAADARIILQ